MNNVLYLWKTVDNVQKWQIVDLDIYPDWLEDVINYDNDIDKSTLMELPVSTKTSQFTYPLRNYKSRSNSVDFDNFEYDFRSNSIEVDKYANDKKYGFVLRDGKYIHCDKGDRESLGELASLIIDPKMHPSFAMERLVDYENAVMICDNGQGGYTLTWSDRYGQSVAEVQTLKALALPGCTDNWDEMIAFYQDSYKHIGEEED